jgi:predicted CoA-binding protein
MKTVVVLGASDKPDRMSNTAVTLLAEAGYRVIPVNPTIDAIGDIPVVHSLAEVPEEPDVLTVYVNPERSGMMEDDIIRLAPGTIIFNPGAENDGLEARLAENGIRILRACTVVLLKTGRFGKEAV